MRTLATLLTLTLPATAAAHGGHWHLDEETLAKLFSAADALYGWFAGNAVTIAALTLAVLTLWGVVWWRRGGGE